MDQPVISADMAHEDHHMMVAYGRHASSGCRARKPPDPIRSQIELATDLAEHVTRRLATAEFIRAARGASADDGGVAVGVDGARGGDSIAAVIGLPPRAGRNAVRAAARVADDQLLANVAPVMMPML